MSLFLIGQTGGTITPIEKTVFLDLGFVYELVCLYFVLEVKMPVISLLKVCMWQKY